MNNNEFKFFLLGVGTAIVAYIVLEYLARKNGNTPILMPFAAPEKTCSCKGKSGCGCDGNQAEETPEYLAQSYPAGDVRNFFNL